MTHFPKPANLSLIFNSMFVHTNQISEKLNNEMRIQKFLP
jgi:hypothetical protein